VQSISRRVLPIEPLDAGAFAPFGDVIDIAQARDRRTINEGFAERFDDLARLDIARGGGRAALSVFRAKRRALPMQLRLVERHRLGSQAFVPLMGRRFLVVVAAAGPAPDVSRLRCFMTKPGQGVNYAAGTWHHPLIALDDDAEFLVIDRVAPDGVDDCDEHSLLGEDVWIPDSPVS
jgi:ureidoglycolate lyase